MIDSVKRATTAIPTIELAWHLLPPFIMITFHGSVLINGVRLRFSPNDSGHSQRSSPGQLLNPFRARNANMTSSTPKKTA